MAAVAAPPTGVSVSPADLLGPYACVFDVGAFQGDFARACLAEWPDCTVHSFEPLLTRRDEPQWYWHRCALGRECKVVEMHRNVFVPSSSVLPMLTLHEEAFPYTKGSEPVQVGMAMLSEFADVVTVPALLKIDVQGYELEVLAGAGEHLDLFDAVVLEVSHAPLYDGAPTPGQLADYLDEHGFVHASTVDVLYHPKRQTLLLQSDELWVRP